MKIKNVKKISKEVALKNYKVNRPGIRRARESSGNYENIIIAADMDVD